MDHSKNQCDLRGYNLKRKELAEIIKGQLKVGAFVL